jgi:hypothetical protein
VEAKSLLLVLVLMFIVAFIFPLTLNYIASQYCLSPETKFFTVILIPSLILAFALYVILKLKL